MTEYRRTFHLFLFFYLIVTLSSRSEECFFPRGVFDRKDEEGDRSLAEEFGRQLRALGEPSLWKRSKEKGSIEVYRLLWIPSFHNTISVRITNSEGDIIINSARLDGKGGVNPGRLAEKKSRKLTEDEFTMLQVHLFNSKFWKIKPKQRGGIEEGLDQDGDDLVIEGVENGKYHVIDGYNVDEDYEKLSLFILKLSGFNVKEAWEYYH